MTRLSFRVARGVVVIAFAGLAAACSRGEQAASKKDWRGDWTVTPGLIIERDASGFTLPTSITFVPRPGPGPRDPLYFVTELRGTVKVVTNDRSVHTFSDGLPVAEPSADFPSAQAETGLAGLCLEPERGYVFVTFTYRDSLGGLHNNIARFQSSPHTFSVRPTGVTSYPEMFAAFPAAVSHQIGPCQVRGDELFVSVGDAELPFESQNRRSPLGKVLRMTLDAAPYPGNPFARVDTAGAGPYIWALGFRNPFGLELVDKRVFVADNGPTIDRFLEARAGGNYLWDGTDWSIGTNADVVLAPGPSPVQVQYYGGGSLLPQQFQGSFLVATSGVPWQPGPGVRGARGIIAIPYDTGASRAAGPPRSLVRFEGSGTQSVTGVALGPDGLYFVPLFPIAGDTTPILRVRYARDPSGYRWASVLSTPNPVSLFHDKGCLGCHSLEGRGGRVGPPLDGDSLVRRVRGRLEARDYGAILDTLNARTDSAYRATRAWRDDVLRGGEMDRVRKWVTYRILDPRFDSPDAQMPNLGLNAQEASLIANHLLANVGNRNALRRVLMRAVPTVRYRHLGLAFGAGVMGGAVLVSLGWWLVLRRRRPRA